MSTELEVLDQLLGGEMELVTIRALFANSEAFARGIVGLLECGDVQMLHHGKNVPRWKWHEVLGGNLTGFELTLTASGAQRIS
jgi:hypothetical protein